MMLVVRHASYVKRLPVLLLYCILTAWVPFQVSEMAYLLTHTPVLINKASMWARQLCLSRQLILNSVPVPYAQDHKSCILKMGLSLNDLKWALSFRRKTQKAYFPMQTSISVSANRCVHDSALWLWHIPDLCTLRWRHKYLSDLNHKQK